MAAAARMDQANRKVQVDRLRLLETLESNKKKHIKDYEEAMAGYKASLLSKIDEAFKKAQMELIAKYEKTKAKVRAFTDFDIGKQGDTFTLLDGLFVEMRVPRSYVADYEAAIDIATWDVNTTMELTHSEFTCFVRDQWDWKSGFDAISTMYKGVR